MPCIFEKIVAGEIPSNKVLENDKFLAFHDINPNLNLSTIISNYLLIYRCFYR